MLADDATDQQQRTLRQKALSVAAYAALLLVMSGIVLRLTVRDAFLLTGLVVYATPPAGMSLLSLFAVACMPRYMKRLRALGFILLISTSFWTYQSQWFQSQNKADNLPPESLRLLFWNVCEARQGWDGILSEVRRNDASVVVMAEADTQLPDTETDSKHFLKLSHRLSLISRFPLSHVAEYSLAGAGVCHVLQLDIPARHLTLLVVDIKSNLGIHRKAPVGRLYEIIRTIPGPVIVAGDFNTPVDSLYLDQFRLTLRNAFEECGDGLHTTWPMPIPIIAIDQVWGNQQIQFRKAQIHRTLQSDHCPIICDFTIAP